MKPLVSILIPAFNAERWISESIQSAISQTWARKEIIVVDDGSTDRTAEVARRLASKNVKVVSTENCGLSGAVNNAFKHCQGDYIQELDADDMLSPDKIERQLIALQETGNKRLLASSPWASFYFRTSNAKFVRNPLCEDLAPVEWLLRKMGQNLHMQNATWLVSREIAETAGPWDETLQYDQDGEYFCRVLLASQGTVFVPEGRVFYRATGWNRISVIGNSNVKRNSLLRSMRLHIQHLRSLEESERVRKACLVYLQNWFGAFYPDRADLVAEVESMAAQLGGRLRPPQLHWKYAWMKPLVGYKAAERVQMMLPQIKASAIGYWDKVMYSLEARQKCANVATPTSLGTGHED